MPHDINNKATNTSVETHIPNSGPVQYFWNKPCQEKGIVYSVCHLLKALNETECRCISSILKTLLPVVWIIMLLFCVVKLILIQQSGNIFCTNPSDKLFNYHWMCINTLICPGSTGEAASGEGSKIRSNRAQSGFKVCTHTCTQWCRGTTWLVMLFSAFKETATSEATQGAAILALSSGVTWLSFHFAGKGKSA